MVVGPSRADSGRPLFVIFFFKNFFFRVGPSRAESNFFGFFFLGFFFFVLFFSYIEIPGSHGEFGKKSKKTNSP